MSIFVKLGNGPKKNLLLWNIAYEVGGNTAEQAYLLGTHKGVRAEAVKAELKAKGLQPVRVQLAPCNFCNRIHPAENTPCSMLLEAPGAPQQYGPVY